MRTAKKHFERGGERMRFTYPSLITATIRLARRYKQRQAEVSLPFTMIYRQKLSAV